MEKSLKELMDNGELGLELLAMLFEQMDGHRPEDVHARLWQEREENAKRILGRWLEIYPEDAESAIATVKELEEEIHAIMQAMHEDYLNRKFEIRGTSEEHSYARRFLMLSVVYGLLKDYENKNGDCYFYLHHRVHKPHGIKNSEEK